MWSYRKPRYCADVLSITPGTRKGFVIIQYIVRFVPCVVNTYRAACSENLLGDCSAERQSGLSDVGDQPIRHLSQLGGRNKPIRHALLHLNQCVRVTSFFSSQVSLRIEDQRLPAEPVINSLFNGCYLPVPVNHLLWRSFPINFGVPDYWRSIQELIQIFLLKSALFQVGSLVSKSVSLLSWKIKVI